VILGVDHVILAVERADAWQTSARLRAAGFAHADAGRHVGQGTANENLALAGGNYVELLFADPPPDPPASWFRTVPRVLGICFGSTDVASDSAGWAGDAGTWTQDLRKTLDDGSDVHFRLAGPHERDAAFFVFLLEREGPAFSGVGAEARLERVTLAGAAADRWRCDLERWIGVRSDGNAIRAGDVELRFERDASPRVRGTLGFAVPRGAGSVALATGSLELRGV
jgi:hypothetical protein